MKTKVYRILVPASSNDGNEYSLEYHQEWDKFVRKITGGVTVLKSAKGQWLSPTGILYVDKMIPCDINCTKKQIKAIADFTKKYYDQEKVAYYKISNGIHLI